MKDSGLEYTIFGHLDEAHLHMNLLPKNMEEYQKGCEILGVCARACQEVGGVLIGEHGIGKLKRRILEGILPKEEWKVYRELKQRYDPDFLLNPENISLWEE